MDERRAQLEAQLSAYLDDELTPQQRAVVEAFLARDAQARAMLAELKAVSSALRGLPRARASSDLIENLRSRMERKALLGEQEARPTKTGSGMSSTGRWVAAATIVLMTGVASYVTWIFNGSDARIASPHQQLTLSERPRNEERPVVGKPFELAMNDSRDAKSVIQQESAPQPERLVAQKAAPPSKSFADSPTESSTVPTEKSVAVALDAAQTPTTTYATNIASKSVVPASPVIQPSPATVLMVACADDVSRQRLLSEVAAVIEGGVAADSEDGIHSCGVIQTAPPGSSVTESDVIVADARTRDDIVRRVSRGSPRKRASATGRQASVATNAPAESTYFGRHAATHAPAALFEEKATGSTTHVAKTVRPNAAADSLGVMAGGIGGQPITSPPPPAGQQAAGNEVAFALGETRPAAAAARGKCFVRLTIHVAEPASSRPAAETTASSPTASSPTASSPTASSPAASSPAITPPTASSPAPQPTSQP